MGQIQHEYLITKILQSHHHHPKSRSLIVENSLERRCHDVRSHQHHLLRSILELLTVLLLLVALKEEKKLGRQDLVPRPSDRQSSPAPYCFQSTSSE
jgi:hypothetical protein